MTSQDRGSIARALALSALAGYVDAIGFLSFGNFFVSFMSGNSTRLGIRIASGELWYALLTCGVIALFVLGVVLGTLFGARFKHRRPAVLLLVAGLLLAASGFHTFGFGRLGIAAMLLAMGAENSVFQREGEISIGLTYMTGTLVKLGQRLASIAQGDKETTWLPYLLLWVGLVTGATLGATAHSFFAAKGLWFGAAAAVLLAYASASTQPGEPAES